MSEHNLTTNRTDVNISTEIHGHIWKDDEIVAELDIPCTDVYDEYIQFGITLPDGTWLELRIPTKQD